MLDPGPFPLKWVPDPLPIPVFSLFVLISILHHPWGSGGECSSMSGCGWSSAQESQDELCQCRSAPGSAPWLPANRYWPTASSVLSCMSKSQGTEGYQEHTIAAEGQERSKTTYRSVITVVPSSPRLPCRNETKFSSAGPLPPVTKDLDFTLASALPQPSCWSGNITSAVIAALKTSFSLWPERHWLAFLPPRKKKKKTSENLLPLVG